MLILMRLFLVVVQHEVLMSLILGLLRSWNDPLYHLVLYVIILPGQTMLIDHAVKEGESSGLAAE